MTAEQAYWHACSNTPIDGSGIGPATWPTFVVRGEGRDPVTQVSVIVFGVTDQSEGVASVSVHMRPRNAVPLDEVRPADPLYQRFAVAWRRRGRPDSASKGTG